MFVTILQNYFCQIRHFFETKSVRKNVSIPLISFLVYFGSQHLLFYNFLAHITVWNEERIESVQTYCRTHETVTTFSESGLLLTQLTNALKYLQACGIEDISLDEIFVCRRKSDVESKLLLLPINVDHGSTLKQVS